MELNNARLPAAAIADLYKDYLVNDITGETPSAPVNQETATSLQYLGNNQKNIGILVHYPDDVYLPDEQLNFLTNILQACRLNMGDAAIVNQYRYPLSFNDLKKQLDCRYLLVFGIAASELAIDAAPEFTTQALQDCQVIFCPPLQSFSNTAEGKLLKSKLWLCLKQLFNV